MAQCVTCGKRLPAFTLGAAKQHCADCLVTQQLAQARAAQGQSAQANQQIPANPPKTGSISTRIPQRAVLLLIGLNLAVYAAMCLRGVSPTTPTAQDALRWGADFGPLTFTTQPWRLFSSMFEHFGAMHLFNNMWCLWQLGMIAELLMGSEMLVVAYLLTGISADLLSLWWRPMTVGAGASGAIFGIAGLLIAVLALGKFDNRVAVGKMLRSVITFAGINLVIGLGVARIDNMAHLGGLLGGLALGTVLARQLRMPPAERRAAWRKVSMVAAVLLLLGFVGLRAHDADVAARYAAAMAIQRRDCATALDALNKVPAGKRDPQYFDLHGYCELDRHQYEAARADYSRALQLDPQDSFAAQGLVEINHATERTPAIPPGSKDAPAAIPRR